MNELIELPMQARHASLNDLVEILRQQHDCKYDVVVPASSLRYRNGLLEVLDPESAIVSEDGVSLVPVPLAVTDIFESGVSEKLGIPARYMSKIRDTAVTNAPRADALIGLLDENVNVWLDHEPTRRFLVRGFRRDDGGLGLARSLLSDRFRPVDNLDTLLAVLAGVKEAGVNVEIADANLSERMMRVRITAPEVIAYAGALLDGYRGLGRFDRDGRRPGATGNTLGAAGHEYRPKAVFAGLEVRNSETGGGAFAVVPRGVFEICSNGLTVTKDAIREIHLGGKLDEGVIEWSMETQRRSIELVKSKTIDAVTAFLSVDFWQKQLDKVDEQAAQPIEDPVATIERVSNSLKFTQEEQASILGFFVEGGQMTAGGVLNAVTAAAQFVDDPDRASDLEDSALDALALAATKR